MSDTRKCSLALLQEIPDRYSLISAAVKPTYRLYDLSGRVAREVKTKTEYNAAVGIHWLSLKADD